MSRDRQMIPKRFFRVWLGPKELPEMFETWWLLLQEMHEDYEFLTITDCDGIFTPTTAHLLEAYNQAASYAGRSDILRLALLFHIGGVYVDADIMPLKPFDSLITEDRPFIGMRSSKSFETAVMGSPAGHRATKDLIDAFPDWFDANKHRSCSVATGPAFVSSVWFGRDDIKHLPPKTFYPYNGFGAPKREEKLEMFSDTRNFPDEMICAHFGNHRWGGKPKDLPS